MTPTRWGALIVALTILAAACGDIAGGPADTVGETLPEEGDAGTSPASTTTTAVPFDEVDDTVGDKGSTPGAGPSSGQAPSGTEPDTVAAAKADLAVQLGVPQPEIELVLMEEIIWRDGSLGCPQPGMAYTQALVDGLRIELRVDGRIYHYHAGGGRAPFLCENPEVVGPSDT